MIDPEVLLESVDGLGRWPTSTNDGRPRWACALHRANAVARLGDHDGNVMAVVFLK